ncbi:MAG: hypothetical protein ACE5DI_02760 [Candidatus Micrarchaeia archaeon]
MFSRGQAALEYAVIVILVLTALLLLAFTVQEEYKTQAYFTQAEATSRKVAEAAELVYWQEEGSRTTVEIYIPPNVKKTSVENQEVTLTIYNKNGIPINVTTFTDANMTPTTLPSSEGRYLVSFELESNGNVSVGLASLISGYSFSFVNPTPPDGSTVPIDYITINISLSGLADYALLDWNGVNESMTCTATYCYANKTSLAETSYSYSVFANNTDGLASQSSQRQATVFLPRPEVNTIIAYFDNLDLITPRYRIYNSSNWGVESNTLQTTQDNRRNHVLKASPTRNEMVFATQTTSNNLEAQVWNGRIWTNFATLASASLADAPSRSFHVAYEQLSGDALVVYRTGTNNVNYRVWDGNTWSSEQSASSIGGSGDLNWIVLASKPGSNEIMLVTLKDDSELHAQVWDGNAWSAAQTLSTNVDDLPTRQVFDVAYESSSGNALAVYLNDGSSNPAYRTYSAGSWSAQSNANNVGASPRWIRLASNPSSDEIMLAVLDSSRDLNAQAWDGSSFAANQELDNNLQTHGQRSFDVAYQADGNAVIAYGERRDTSPAYRTWNGASWSSPSNIVNIGSNTRWIELAANASGNDMVFADLDAAHDLSVTRWDGSSWSGYQEIERRGDRNYKSFATAYRAD